MKHLKMLALAAISALALVAFVGAGTASAAGGVVCSTATNPCTSKWPKTTIEFSLKSGTSASLTSTSGSVLDTCTTSTVSGELKENPGAGGQAVGPIKSLTWETGATPCTATPTQTVKAGGLRVESAGSGKGTLFANETVEVTVNVFSSCNYGVEPGTNLGSVSEGIGTAVVFKANAIAKKLNGGFLCPETAKWVAEYVLTKPSNTTFYVSTS